MTRQTQALGEPPTRLTGFPRWPLRHDRTLYRAHTTARGPWWFASAHGTGTDGRFDLAAPYGTCYLAGTVNSAVRERWGEHMATLRTITHDMANTTTVSALHTPHLPRLADMLSAKAARFGAIREIGTATPYAPTQRWATALHQLGTGGIRYCRASPPALATTPTPSSGTPETPDGLAAPTRSPGTKRHGDVTFGWLARPGAYVSRHHLRCNGEHVK